MKLRRQPGKPYTNKAGETVNHDRFVVAIPRELVEALGWKEGLELTPTRRGSTLTLRPEGTTD
jgi:bifunctional DNA-binding transcriptional regulator/antitoxin component of YhaV-PrlF toxin-antitoxin module